ncbi:Bacterial protein of uncharacterised function (DUF951) [Aedoeadaptatus ivorii]|uniref:Bacterial protein of uncharacterized function (DUF951) n=1 Tax=Aedoeadaptatus ivorii TaxID=54006 RepID=A0A3S4YL62_9FIRM|nr:DUF951 domain-containing protein [Peptoniphilus ivorii]MDQ0508169.1 hypothetical protein [Peptoniphilus ivorii]VEJ35899.1 Bacterial protein of uncharacterised function (DUF951) [Peptoniphilus ivorii]
MNRLFYREGDVVTLKKSHACGENLWRILRTGVDIKLECMGCDRTIWMTRMEFEKRVRKIREGDKMVSIVHHRPNEEEE